ncbi:MAG TPA: AAA family ATPase [Steroidobacteraceae bacterium]|nr:AAA family ATPase [Steroidobacteraceae bacterium]
MNSLSVPAPAPFEAFGLNDDPFAACENDASFFPSDQHLRALEFMGHALWTRARLGVVTAQHGCGKSLLISRFVRDLDDRVVVAAVSRETTSARDFLLEVLGQFGIAPESEDKTDRRRLAERFLTHQASKGRLCLLVVENAQSMHPSVLEELRVLAAVEHEGSRVLKLLLLGQSALTHVLESPRMAELRADAAPRFSLEPLSDDQTAAYVAHRLRAAGAEDPDALMPYTLMPQIYACTGGVPLQINRLCSKALTNAAMEQATAVTAAVLEQAVDELKMRDRALPAFLQQSANEADSQATSRSKLIVSLQGNPDREIELTSDRVLIGRGDEADVRIDSVFVSRYHALILRDGKQDVLLDLGSTNGLLVNSRRIIRRALRDRDLIQIGPTRVTYQTTLPAAAATQQPDPGETVCFARPGFPQTADEEQASATGAVLGFGRADTTASR